MTSTRGTGTAISEFFNYTNEYISINDLVTTTVKVDTSKGISPQLYFSYVKKNLKLSTIEQFKLEKRLRRLEKAFDKAVDNGQDVLAKKMLDLVYLGSRESILYAKGYKMFIEDEVLRKHKKNIRGGHISDTEYSEYTRLIPQDVIDKKKKSDPFFDSFVIYHYWSPEAKDVKTMSESEKARMKDPILFGQIKGSTKLYFIADWTDEFCDLTFDELIDEIGQEAETELSHKPELE
jgi:hypothetical protein